MRVLDLDMDYFLDHPVFGVPVTKKKRVDDPECINSVWSEERVRSFLENNLGLTKSKKSKGRIVEGHDEALYFWEELIDSNQLTSPFSVVHVDSHGDLGFGAKGKKFVLEILVSWPIKIRKPKYCNDPEYGGEINIANYLLFAIAFRWISELTYCENPKAIVADVPEDIILDDIPDPGFQTKFESYIHLESKRKDPEPIIPFTMISTMDEVDCAGDFDFVLLAQSPNYTPENADFIMDIFREYIDEI